MRSFPHAEEMRVRDCRQSLPRVMVAHHGRQHSHQLALALHREGWLVRYVSGLPTHAEAGWRWARPVLRRYARYDALDVDPSLVRHLFVAPIVARALAPVLSEARRTSFGHRVLGLFDRLVAPMVAAVQPTIVVAYENAALRTFRRARALGITTVLDAASFHHAWQDRFYAPQESPRAHRRIVTRKDGELALADHVLTVSEYARQSYLDAGVPADRVHAVPMGAATERLGALQDAQGSSPDGPLRFVFVGHLDQRKGADLLLAAARRLAERGEDFEVTFIGKGTLTGSSVDNARIRTRGWIPQRELFIELQRHDVLVLPSRHDSFGMVVAEAMASGLPAIVSSHVGAKEMVTPGVNGLIVPADDAAALADAMQWFARRRNALSTMRQAARRSAERYSWDAYRRRVVGVVREIAGSPFSKPDDASSPEYGE